VDLFAKTRKSFHLTAATLQFKHNLTAFSQILERRGTLHFVVITRPITSLGYQEGRRVFWEGPKFFELCSIVLNDVQHIFSGGAKYFLEGLRPPAPPGYGPGHHCSKIMPTDSRQTMSTNQNLSRNCLSAFKKSITSNKAKRSAIGLQFLRVNKTSNVFSWCHISIFSTNVRVSLYHHAVSQYALIFSGRRFWDQSHSYPKCSNLILSFWILFAGTISTSYECRESTVYRKTWKCYLFSGNTWLTKHIMKDLLESLKSPSYGPEFRSFNLTLGHHVSYNYQSNRKNK